MAGKGDLAVLPALHLSQDLQMQSEIPCAMKNPLGTGLLRAGPGGLDVWAEDQVENSPSGSVHQGVKWCRWRVP